MFKSQHCKETQSGFALPMILTFIVLLGVVGTALVQNSVQTNGSAVLHSQVQIAHVASKAAIDYAEEQYELNAAYNGTPEQDLFVNDYYRATIEVQILFDQSSSAKRVQGIGRVYIPETSSSARVIRDIKSTIIRNGEVIVTAGQTDPATYNPVLWLDANQSDSLFTAAANNTQTISGLYGSGSADIVEEGGSDANNSSRRGQLNFGNDDLDMAWGGNAWGTQTIGLRFRNIQTPRNATVDQAYIQFTTDTTQSAGYVQFTVQAVAQDDPDPWSGDYAVTNAPKTTASVLWEPANWNTVGASGENERVDVTSIVQELVDRGGWNPNQAMAFSITWVTGSGRRTAEKGQSSNPSPELFIQWDSASSGAAVTPGASIDSWLDRSGNSNDAQFEYGTRPTLQLNQVNGLNAVRFSNNGALLSSLSSLSGDELVAFMVMRPNTSSESNARFLSIMNSSSNSDSNTSNGLIPFMRNGGSSTIQQYYNNSTGRSISGAIDGNWGTFTSRMSTQYSERLLKNSTPDNYQNEFSPSYTVNQIYLGGSRSGSIGANYANMDVAEVIVYDRAFICSELQSIENYLEAKYGFSYSDKDPCP